MRLFGLNRRHSNTILLAIGQLLLIAYVFQVAAIEHWQVASQLNVTGVVGSSAHTALHADHCHGAPASCADSSAGFAHMVQNAAFRTPEEPPAFAIDARPQSPIFRESISPPLGEPPRAAWLGT